MSTDSRPVGPHDKGIQSLLRALHVALAQQHALGTPEAAPSSCSSPEPLLSLWCRAGLPAAPEELIRLTPGLTATQNRQELRHKGTSEGPMGCSPAETGSREEVVLPSGTLQKPWSSPSLPERRPTAQELRRILSPGQAEAGPTSSGPLVCQNSSEGVTVQLTQRRPVFPGQLPHLVSADTPRGSPRSVTLASSKGVAAHEEGQPRADLHLLLDAEVLQHEAEGNATPPQQEQQQQQQHWRRAQDEGLQEQLLKWRQQFQQLLLQFLVVLLTQTTEGQSFLSKLNLSPNPAPNPGGPVAGPCQGSDQAPAAPHWPQHINLRELIATVLRAFLFQSAAAAKHAAGAAKIEEERVSPAKVQHELQQLRQIQNLMWDLHCVQTQAMPWVEQPLVDDPAKSECSGIVGGQCKRLHEEDELEVESCMQICPPVYSQKRARAELIDLNVSP